ncbi:hypothetical protein [uncultured Microbacterium sp.]|uniref:hypothetical protein n=1 Tax=uncultured Microbacterium sp. TaxID=191216 RepID=UPI0035CA1376
MTQDGAEPTGRGVEPAQDGKSPALTPAMRGVIFGALGLLAIAVVVFAVLLNGSNAGPGSTSGSATGSSSSGSTTAGPVPGATPTSGSEVLAPTAAPETTLPPIAPPSSAPATPLIAPPYPASATADFALVDGFPEQIMGPAPASDILQSAISTEGTVMQVTLVGRTDASPDEVRAHYAQQWAALGLADAGTSADGSLSFTGAFESLSVSATVGGTGTRYTVFGVFRAS